LALVLVHALTGGRWGIVTRPWLLLGISLLPLLLLALFPLLFLIRDIYPWARPDADLPNSFYLNPLFAALRWVFYLIIWFGLGALVLSRHDRPLGAIAPGGLILLGLTANFAAIDSVMSLDPHFNSSVFGMMSAAEAGLFALSVTVLGTVLSTPVDLENRNDLGRLLQGLLVLWAYLDFMQLLIVWQSDLPHEAPWYLLRFTGFWGIVAAVIAVGHFLLPFFALLLPSLRRSVRGMAMVASVLVVMGVLRAWWLVLPQSERSIGWIDIAPVMALGGISIGVMLRGPSQRWRVIHA
jgi:hypothetical protein